VTTRRRIDVRQPPRPMLRATVTFGSRSRLIHLRLRDTSWSLTLLTAGGALAVTLILTGTRLLVPSEQAVISSADWPWTHDGVAIEPLRSDGQLRSGDVVVAMNGIALETWAADAFRLPWSARTTPVAADPDLGDSVRFDVRREGGTLSVESPRLALAPDRVGGAPLGLVIFGVSVLGLALILLIRRPRVTALRLLFVVAATNMADLVAWELDLQPTDLAVRTPYLFAFCAAAGFNLIFWSAIVHLLSIYPVRSPLTARHSRAIPALYAAPFVALAAGLVIARLAGGTVLDWIGRWAAVQALVASAMVILILVATIAGYRRTREPRRHQVRWIALALGVAAAMTLGLLTVPIVVLDHPLVERTTVDLFALPVPIALALAVIRDRLFQVDLLARSRGRIVAAREDERRRLRRDLHDGLGPTLAAIGLKLDLAREQLRSDPRGVAPLLDEVRVDVRSVISDVRRLARELRPPTLDTLGLVGAIEQQASALGGATGPSIGVEVDGPLPPLPAAIEVAAFRIATEAMTNVVRHAGATSCIVRLAVDRDGFVIEITDDGQGVGPNPSTGVGLRSIDERAAEVGGEVDLVARPEGGTTVRARLPIRDDDRVDRPTEGR
jgi:signal transduction histidine kinase